MTHNRGDSLVLLRWYLFRLARNRNNNPYAAYETGILCTERMHPQNTAAAVTPVGPVDSEKQVFIVVPPRYYCPAYDLLGIRWSTFLEFVVREVSLH